MISTKQDIVVPKTGTYISGRLYSAIKYKANLRNINFEVSLKFLDKLFESQGGLCYYSGLSIDGKTRNQVTASLDRTNSDLGYIESNVRWVHKDVNFMKHTASEAHFFDLIELIHERRNDIDT
ncbi:endonuclease [Rhodococcus phage Trina]|uniref:HNH endonuclease n=1 Tax=Rhodococcus phage Trina TaxID=2027905 RepID=A0A2D0ZWJ6_9CAUD|nr:endonuclease [Rhodococcus phage Trina]ASZ74873.1 HNH endonuclease [Rhodococcus phage Trina]